MFNRLIPLTVLLIISGCAGKNEFANIRDRKYIEEDFDQRTEILNLRAQGLLEPIEQSTNKSLNFCYKFLLAYSPLNDLADYSGDFLYANAELALKTRSDSEWGPSVPAYAIPEMAKNGGGAIVNLSSVAGLGGGYTSLLYPTTKGTIVNMTRVMAAHHGAQGIRVNCVAPGMVYTPMVASRGMTPELREARRQRSLLQTEGTGWDIGEAVVFLASDAARWITGVVLPVDAGATAGLGLVPVPASSAGAT